MISIAMTTYNGEKYLREQLDSILNQTYSDFELIICDDCSKDNTRTILSEYTAKDSRIKIFMNEKNIGFKKNFEKAISLCSGEYIALSDQDDIWLENHLEILIDNVGDADLICANCQLMDNNNLLNQYSRPNNIYIPSNQLDLFQTLLHINFVQGCVSLFSNEIKKILLPIPQASFYHDYWLSVCTLLANKKIKYIPNVINYYRRHDDNITSEKNNYLQLNYERKIIFFNYLLSLDISDDLKKIINQVILYNKSILNPKLRCKTFIYYMKNYKKIYQTNSYKLFFFRFIKKFIFLR